ncbi:IclR family transcriptional regulator [Leucobacter sp. GX24907]
MNELLGDKPVQRAGQVQSVARALSILNMLGDPQHSSGLGLTQIAQELGVSKSTAHALLQTLKQYGFVTRIEPGPRFLLGMSLMRLGEKARKRMPIIDAAQPVLQSLASATRTTSRLAVVDHGYPLYVSFVEQPGNIQFTAQIGKRERPHTTGVGKVILASMSDDEALAHVLKSGLDPITPHTITDPDELVAELHRIRDRGFAVDQEEESIGIKCVAAGFSDPAGHCIGAISVSGLAVHMTPERIEEVAVIVKDHAERLSASLM